MFKKIIKILLFYSITSFFISITIIAKTINRDPFMYKKSTHIKNSKNSEETLILRATITCPDGQRTTIESYTSGITKKIPSTIKLKG